MIIEATVETTNNSKSAVLQFGDGVPSLVASIERLYRQSSIRT
ncbi:hypothetical protein TRIP_C60051 [Candidatus Zixiibacteriota bacterium]|nr:hypothetical protein TRIP_C60051 [candidate division Zixibacteria bacterium]